MWVSPLRLAGLGLLLVVGLAVGAAPAAADDGNVTLYQVDDDVDEPGEIEAAVEDGSAEPAGRLVAGDRLAVVIDSDRFAADLEDRNGSTTERFFAALDGDADLRVIQTNPPPERATKIVPLGPENTAVHRNGTTVYALVDTGELTFERPNASGNEPASLEDGDRFAFTFGYDLDQFADDGPEVELYTTASKFVTVSTNWFDPLPPERVNRSVQVNVEPEDDHYARVALDDGREVTAPVEPVEWSDHRGVSLDLGDVAPGTGYAIELVHDGEVVDSYDGTVREPTATVRNATVTERNNWTAVNATANLSHGGEVRVLNEDDERLGWTSVPPNTETHVTITLRGSADELVVRAARESGAAEEFYADAGTTIDFSDRELRDPIATPTETETTEAENDGSVTTMDTTGAAETATATGTGTETATGTETGGSGTADDQPGFGGAVAVAALLATGLLARRRS